MFVAEIYSDDGYYYYYCCNPSSQLDAFFASLQRKDLKEIFLKRYFSCAVR